MAAGIKTTPDVVLVSELFINGRRVHWIDSKCYYGSACSKIFVKSLKTQSKRYDDALAGPGAIIYKHGN